MSNKEVSLFIQNKAKYDFCILKKWTDFSLKKESETTFYNELENLIQKQIQEKLDHDFNGLLRFLYQEDISEKKIKAVFDGSFSDEVAKKITKLYIERCQEKYNTRKAFENKDEIGDW
jgi:hypothetical protein